MTDGVAMPRVIGIDHLVLSVGDLARSKAYYRKVLGFLGFRLKYELGDFAGWSNGKTLFWIDRKSTRLNSSHGYISYAVFCLKKKITEKGEGLNWNSSAGVRADVKVQVLF